MKLRAQYGWVLAYAWFGIGSCGQSANPDADDGSVRAEAGVDVVTQSLLAPVEVTLTAAADTHIAQSTPTLNFGSETTTEVTGVALSGWEAGIVRFDTAAIRNAVGAGMLQTARLQLTMSAASLSAGNSQMTIHRMTVPWVEQRATWLCANDTDHSILGRFVNNCTAANRWGIEWWSFLPRPFVEQPSAIVPLGFGQTGVVTADVTSDVQLTLNGTSHEGWLLASTASLSSVWARFSSREGSAPAKLLLTIAPACVATGPDTDCDGVDDNCNGQIDEAYVSTSTSCGTGGCARTGATSCVAGSVRDSCTPGTPAVGDATCNGVDDNCNGSVDESYVAQTIACGPGACARNGVTSCTGGAVQNVCTPGTPATSDASCDGVDDNCNGATDEGYVATLTTCGIGACSRTGMTACVAGSVQSPCTPGMPSATDATCDAIDDDCNGAVDDGYLAQSTTCGTGACARTGATSCVGGTVQDGCLPGTPTDSDATCDGLDDDCSGTADEDFGQETTTCTVDGCSAYGATTCNAGQVIDTCASAPTCFSELDCTDGVDNDSDVQTDCADSDCVDAPSCAIALEICGNNLDDDADGLPDCADLDCVSVTPCNNIPPIAADVAPPLDPTLYSRNIAALQFLIDGPTPIQVGVAPGTLVPEQAALVSGRVLTEGGAPLPAVLVDVAHHPELGLTYTDAKGEFHLAVNGGALFTLRFSLAGYVPAQRQVRTRWGQGATADDLILLVRTPEVTTVDASGTAANAQVVAGPLESDANGTRRATLIVPAGTAIQVYDAAGNVSALPQLSFRLTEHTVGEHGPERMPAPLPPTSAYTYAIDISADEAQYKLNGIDALLSEPIPFYVDNFLSFPIGTSIPTGYYDNDANEWKAIDSGVTLAILGEQEGRAQVDSNGDNIADTPAMLAALAIDDAELALLATRYEPGASMWRVRLPHLSTYDLNMGQQPDGDTNPPTPTTPPQVPPHDPTAPPCTMAGNSTVTCFRQVLDEEVPVAGTPYALHYTSERVPGRIDNRHLNIPVRVRNLAAINVMEVFVRITPPVGRMQTFGWLAGDAPESFSWTWDGLDTFGRRLVGRYPVAVEVTYAYACRYGSPGRFAYRDGNLVPVIPNQWCRAPLSSRATLTVESWDAQQAGLGGWDLTEHHSFHPDSGELMMGDGRRQVGGETLASTLAAGPFPWPYGAAMNIRDTAIAPDGTIYVVTAEAGIFRQRPKEAAQLLIPRNVVCSDPYVDSVCDPRAIAVDRAGHLIIVDSNPNPVATRVLRVNSRTLATKRIAGGPPGFSGDGGHALNARFMSLGDVAVQQDGSLLLLDGGNSTIRRIQEGGVVERIAGIGSGWSFGDQFHETAEDASSLKISLTGESELVPAENPQAIVAPFGQRTELTLDGRGYFATIKPDPAHPAYRFTYRPDGLMTDLLDPAGSHHAYEYNNLGLLSRTQDALGGYHQYDLARTGGTQTVTDTTALGRVTTYEYTRNRDGSRNFRITFPTGQVNVRAVDKNDVSTTTLSDGTVSVSTLVPDPTLGAQSLLENEVITTPAGRTQTRNVSRSIAQTAPNNPLTLTTLTQTATDNGRVSTSSFTKSNRTWTITSPEARVATAQIDGQGRVVKTSTGGTLPFEFRYDNRGRLLRADQPLSASVTERFTNFNYDPSTGYLESQTNALAHVTSYQRDAVGRVEHLIQADGGDTVLAYDAESRVTSVTPPERSAHALTYTAVDQSKGYVAPQVGASPTITTYDYDLDRELKSITQPDGQQQTLTYDPGNGRLQSSSIPGAGSTTYEYDGQSRLQTLSNDAGQGTITFGYDGSLVTTVATSGTHSVRDATSTLWSGSVGGSVVYNYDNQLEVSSVEVRGPGGAANGLAAQYTRDDDELVTSIAPLGGGSVPALTLTRSPLDGHLVTSTQGVVSTEYAMDVNASAPGYGELQGISHKVNGTELYGVIYQRDSLGRVEQLEETIEGESRTRKYTYDNVGRLHMVLDENDALIHRYEYDGNGARIREESGAGTIMLGTNLGCGPTLNTPVDAQDRLCRYGEYDYTYDANGRLSSKTQLSTGAQTAYVYDGTGSLRTVLQPDGDRIDYVLDALGRRVGKVIGGTMVRGWLYGKDSLRPLAQLDITGQIEATFVYQTHGNVPEFIVSRSGSVFRVLTDHLGSVRFIVDVANGDVVQRLSYDDFGNVLADNGTLFQPFGFAGGLYDADTGLVRFGARDYDAVTGRWTAKDPILFRGGQTNLYAYVHNDPINLNDPTGLWEVFGFGSIGFGNSGPVRVGAEGIAIGGYNSESGFYAADIGAAGGHVGGQANYVGVYRGFEATTEGETVGITLYEGAVGVEIPFLTGVGLGAGAYDSDSDHGIFVFAHGGFIGEHGALGVGWSTKGWSGAIRDWFNQRLCPP